MRWKYERLAVLAVVVAGAAISGIASWLEAFLGPFLAVYGGAVVIGVAAITALVGVDRLLRRN